MFEDKPKVEVINPFDKIIVESIPVTKIGNIFPISKVDNMINW